MKRLADQPWIALAATVVALAVSSLLPVHLAHRLTDGPRGGLLWIMSPITGLAKSLVDPLRAPDQVPADQAAGDDLRENYEQLLAYARRLETDLVRKDEQIAQLSRAREMGLSPGARLLSARVTGWSSGGNVNPSLTIDRGEQHGVALGQVVADGFHLIGQISEIWPRSAAVRLITAPTMILGVRIVPPTPGEPSRSVGLILRATDDPQLLVGRCSVDEPVEVDDLAHLADRNWPNEAAGYVVGRVTRVAGDPTDPLRRIVHVRPLRSLTHVSRVLIVTPSVATDEAGAGAPAGSPPAPPRGLRTADDFPTDVEAEAEPAPRVAQPGATP